MVSLTLKVILHVAENDSKYRDVDPLAQLVTVLNILLQAVIQKPAERRAVAAVKTPVGGHSLVMGYWGCVAGRGRIFTTRLTIMGSPF